MEQNDGASAVITPNVPLAALSPVERKRVEAVKQIEMKNLLDMPLLYVLRRKRITRSN